MTTTFVKQSDTGVDHNINVALYKEHKEDYGSVTEADLNPSDNNMDVAEGAYFFRVRLYNNGASNMLVHRIYTGHKNLIVTGPKNIKAGKYGEIKLTLNTKDIKPGNYTHQLQVITNDPKQPKSLINCKFSIAE